MNTPVASGESGFDGGLLETVLLAPRFNSLLL